MNNKKNASLFLTKEGVNKLKKELHQLVNVDRVKVIDDLQKAYANRDLKENFDYIAAKISQGEIEQRIVEIEYILSHYKLISTSTKDKKTIHLGSVVEFCEVKGKENKKTGDEQQIKIVGSVEFDPFSQPAKISSNSVLAQALINNRAGDIVEVNVAKKYKVKILAVK